MRRILPQKLTLLFESSTHIYHHFTNRLIFLSSLKIHQRKPRFLPAPAQLTVVSQVRILLLQYIVTLFLEAQLLLQPHRSPILLARHHEMFNPQLLERLPSPHCRLQALEGWMLGRSRWSVVSRMVFALGYRLKSGVPFDERVMWALALGFRIESESLRLGDGQVPFVPV